jgi:hypothetical protein
MPMALPGHNLPRMTNQTDDVVAYSFTVTPVKDDDEDFELADPFERVQFEHPDETYGKHDGFEVNNVTELTEL